MKLNRNLTLLFSNNYTWQKFMFDVQATQLKGCDGRTDKEWSIIATVSKLT